MQSLLSASESNILQSFLSVMDYPDDTLTPRELALLSAAPRVPTSTDTHSFVETATPNSDHKEALAKATKDLMALEPDHWRLQSAMQDPLRSLQHHAMQLEFHHRRQQSALGLNTAFSFPQTKLQLDPQLAHMNDLKPSTSPSATHLQPPPDDAQQHTALLQLSHQLMEPTPNGNSTRNATHTSSSSSRPELHPSSASSSSTASSLSSPSASKHTSNPSSSKRNRASSSASPTSSATPSTTPTQKQALLSPSQKKANHIQSEQKRRANIRRGYEALCETVPALREAIKQEEDEAAVMAEQMNGGPGRRRRKKGQAKDGLSAEKEKIDGRAGPRSENVVLTKTIDHIQNLLADRSALLARLHQARSMLPSGHPALTPLQAEPPWEREWKGGQGKVVDEDEGASSEGDVYE